LTIRVLVAKPGLDGHDRGAIIVAKYLRDEGFEVIYTGLRQTPEKIIATAIQEDVQIIGLSILSGAHNTLFNDLITLIKENNMNDVIIIAGGIIPDEDKLYWENNGINKIFGPGTSLSEIGSFIKSKFETLIE
jgi:methylmalonyl-CoA mutase C-terminal domain/subunit